MTDPVAEWSVCLDLLDETAAFLRELNRNAIRLDGDWPDAEFNALKDMIDAYLYPYPLPQPYERLADVTHDPGELA